MTETMKCGFPWTDILNSPEHEEHSCDVDAFRNHPKHICKCNAMRERWLH